MTHTFHLPAGEMTVTLQDDALSHHIDGGVVTLPSLQLDGGILVMEFVVMCYNYLAPLLVLIVVYLFLYFFIVYSYYILYSILLLKLPSLSDCMKV